MIHPLRDPETYRYVVRVSQSGRSSTVEGPATTIEGGCYSRPVICRCDNGHDHKERAAMLAELLNREHATAIAAHMAEEGLVMA